MLAQVNSSYYHHISSFRLTIGILSTNIRYIEIRMSRILCLSFQMDSSILMTLVKHSLIAFKKEMHCIKHLCHYRTDIVKDTNKVLYVDSVTYRVLQLFMSHN